MIDEADVRVHTAPLDITNYYCPCGNNRRGGTTKHKVSAGGSTLTCQECGSIKHKQRRPVMAALERELNRVLFLEDEPPKVKINGTQHTSAAGAHRPDKGTKFTQLKIDNEFSHKSNNRAI